MVCGSKCLYVCGADEPVHIHVRMHVCMCVGRTSLGTYIYVCMCVRVWGGRAWAHTCTHLFGAVHPIDMCRLRVGTNQWVEEVLVLVAGEEDARASKKADFVHDAFVHHSENALHNIDCEFAVSDNPAESNNRIEDVDVRYDHFVSDR